MDEDLLLLIVSSPSGAGKTTLTRRLLERSPELRFSVSHTTRPPRAGEQDGVEYHFVSEAAFEEQRARGSFLEWAEVYGHRYGTSQAELQRAEREGLDLVLDVDVQGAAQVKALLEDAVSVFILPPSFSDLERRLRGRAQDDDRTIAQRLAGARRELTAWREYEYVLVNDNLDGCVEDLKSVVRAARRRKSRMCGRAGRILETFE